MTEIPVPKLSICIPTYNRARLLERMLVTLELALANALEESYEVIFRDNASTDSTPEIIARFAERHPVRYARNDENIGVTRNILSVPLDATGEFVWMLGDDDLIAPEAFLTIFKQLEETPDVDGHIAAHAIMYEDRREESEKMILSGGMPDLDLCLTREGVSQTRLNRFEDVFSLSDVTAPLNFLSNVIFRQKRWAENAESYLKHCEKREWFTDTISTAGYMCVWADFLTGRPVGLIATPLVVGFVGQQQFLSKWETLSTVFFLDVSKWFLKNGAAPDRVLIYKRKIYGDAAVIARLATSADPYTKKHFSLARLIRGYGDDPQLWRSLNAAVRSVSGRRKRIALILRILTSTFSYPSKWVPGTKFALQQGRRIVYDRLHARRTEKPIGYLASRAKMDAEATDHFRKSVHGGEDANVRHPVHLKNPHYVNVGAKMTSEPNLRVEAWDSYGGKSYSPAITIGDGVIFNFNCHIGCIGNITIGHNTLIGSNVLITDHQHGDLRNLIPATPFRDQPLHSKGSVVIGENVWIGENACIMPGVTVGAHSVIGANAVVTGDIPSGTVVAGIPARVISSLGTALTKT